MSRSTDPGHFFQTDASEAIRARRAAKSGNKNGHPILLQSKILDVVADPFSSSCVYVAESAGCVRRVNIETGDKTVVYRGPSAPLTSVVIGGARGETIFAGCWDKDVWSWDRGSRVLSRRYKGHSDFVKTLVCAKISGKDILISGGADSKIIVWDSSSGDRLHTLRDVTDSMRAVQFLVIDPIGSSNDGVVLVSSSSDPHIRRWKISLTSAGQIANEAPDPTTSISHVTSQTIREHETSVYRLLFDTDDGDLWTASADGTAKCLSRAGKWASEEIIMHGDYVRAIALTSDWIITAGRDEDVKVWDRASGKLFYTYEGHFEEVTGLVVTDGGKKIVSVSIDGSVRLWPLGRVDLEKARKENEDKAQGLLKEIAAPKKSLLTDEEEAELAELMDDED